MDTTVEEIQIDLDQALDWLAGQTVQGKLSGRIESACDAATAAVVELYGAELDSKSKAVRDLLRRGAASLAAERAATA